MKFKDPKTWGVAFGAGILASVVMLPQAKGELVYESEIQAQTPQGAARAEDRESLRQVIQSSEKAQTAVQSQNQNQVYVAQVPAQAQPQVVVQQQAAPSQIQVGSASELENLSKHEMMRRERVRAELRNEDILQERLEELRLRDEKRRTESLFGAQGSAPMNAPMAPQAPMQQEVVGAAATQAPIATMPPAPVSDQVVTSSSSVTSVSTAVESSDRTTVMVSPRAGLSNMNGTSIYDIRPHYSAGIGLGLGVSDNVSFEVGYQFNEYGVALNSTNAFVASYQAWTAGYGNNGQLESVAMKQNVADAGLKVHFLGPDSRLRPFIGGGAAYSKSYINYDQRILAALNQSGLQGLGQDYEVSSFLGTLSTGVDVRVSKAISVGLTFKYHTVLSARQNQNLNNMAMYGGYNAYAPYNSYYNGLQDTDKQMVGGSLASASFYSVLGGATFSF